VAELDAQDGNQTIGADFSGNRASPLDWNELPLQVTNLALRLPIHHKHRAAAWWNGLK